MRIERGLVVGGRDEEQAFFRQKLPDMHVMALRGDNGSHGCLDGAEQLGGETSEAGAGLTPAWPGLCRRHAKTTSPARRRRPSAPVTAAREKRPLSEH